MANANGSPLIPFPPRNKKARQVSLPGVPRPSAGSCPNYLLSFVSDVTAGITGPGSPVPNYILFSLRDGFPICRAVLIAALSADPR